MGKIDDAYKNFVEAEQFALAKRDTVMLVRIYNGMAVVFTVKKELQKALDYYEKAIKANKKIGDKQLEAGILNNVGTIYLEQKKFSDAIV